MLIFRWFFSMTFRPCPQALLFSHLQLAVLKDCFSATAVHSFSVGPGVHLYSESPVSRRWSLKPASAAGATSPCIPVLALTAKGGAYQERGFCCSEERQKQNSSGVFSSTVPVFSITIFDNVPSFYNLKICIIIMELTWKLNIWSPHWFHAISPHFAILQRLLLLLPFDHRGRNPIVALFSHANC